MYKLVSITDSNCNYKTNVDEFINKINDEMGHILYVTSNKYRLFILYEV